MTGRLHLLAALPALATAGPALAQHDHPPSVGELVITAAPYDVAIESATTSVNVLKRGDIDLAAPSGLGDLLNGQPGLRSTSYGPGASRPVIRGLSGPRVLILQNGAGLVDASALSPDHAVATDPNEAERIEVLRGPSALAYGGAAIGGVVNVIDDRIPSRRIDGLAGRVAGSYNAGDDGTALSGALKYGAGPVVFSIDGVSRRSGPYDVPVNPTSAAFEAESGETALPDRQVKDVDIDLSAYGAGVSYVGDGGHIGLSVKRSDMTYGVPHPQIVTAAPEEPIAIDLTQTRYDLRGEAALGFGPFERVRGSLGHTEYDHVEFEPATGAQGTRFVSSGTEGRLEMVQRDRGGWQGAVGVQGLTRDFEAIGAEAFVPPVGIEEAGVFALQRYDAGAWGVEGGLRFDRRTLDADLSGRTATSGAGDAFGLDWTATPQERRFSNVSATAAAFWRPNEAAFVGLSLAHNSRAPSEFELFADGPHEGTGTYELGDPTLKAERVTSLEATGRWSTERLRLEAHLFAARYNSFIDEADTGLRAEDDGTIDPAGELPVFRYRQTRADFQGFEVAGSYVLWEGGERSLALEGSLDQVRGKTPAGNVARIPPASVTAALHWQDARLDARLEARHVQRQSRLAAFETPTAGYTLVNVEVSYLPIADKDLRLFVEGRNLTDEEAREHASFLKDIAPQPGRTVRVGFAARF